MGTGEMVRTLRRRKTRLGGVGPVGGLAANGVNWNNTIDFSVNSIYGADCPIDRSNGSLWVRSYHRW
jgi:hypothetical protein